MLIYGAGSGRGAVTSYSPQQTRHVLAEELDGFGRHLVRLTDECRRSRFGNSTTDAFLHAYAGRVDHANTLVLAFVEANEMRGAAELRSLQAAWCNEAEAAFSVEKRYRRRGIGTSLMVEVVRAARRFGVEHIYLSCHIHNRAMQRIAEKFAAELRFEDTDCFARVTVR
jgi:RimJ/RimL family protein N-acetyltransferase